MGTTNLHWYARNALRAYPVDDRASAVDNAGVPLPRNLLADLNIRWPEDLGDAAFLAACTLTPTLITVMIQAAETIGGPVGIPLAAVSLPRPVKPGVAIRLAALTDRVAGWIVFGDGILNDSPYAGRFSGPAQSLLCPRSARAYRLPGVLSAKSATAGTSLRGVVQLSAKSPLAISAQVREIDGNEVTAIVLELKDSSQPFGQSAIAQTLNADTRVRSVLEEFAGPCSPRPESLTCGDPRPITTVAGVTPDCDGQITLEFTGQVEPWPNADGTGMVIDVAVGISSICNATSLPDSDGKFPGEAADPSVDPIGSFEVDCKHIEIQAGTNKQACPSYAGDAEVVSGEWITVADTQPAGSPCPAGTILRANSASQISLLDLLDSGGSVDRYGETMFRLQAGPTGARRNAIGVFNLSAAGSFPHYFMAMVDYDRQAIVLQCHDGRGVIDLDWRNIANLALNQWYKLTWGIESTGQPCEVAVSVHLESVGGGGVDETLEYTIGILGYAPGTGHFGLAAHYAVTDFAYVKAGAL